MASSARIDELLKKFNENPRRYFAPLADEYRKSGDPAAAIEICRVHLAQQPGHMSGHIVLGKALYESGSLDQARGTFLSALELDPENLIALRHLGDIARAQGDSYGARQWYQRVLDADPRNDEIAAQVRELDAMPATEAFGGTSHASEAGHDALGSPVEPHVEAELSADLEDAPDTLAESPVADGTLPPAIEPAALAYMAEEPSLDASAPGGSADGMLDLDAADFDIGMTDGPPVSASTSERVSHAPVKGELDAELDAFSGSDAESVDGAPVSTWASMAPSSPTGRDALGLESMEFEAPSGVDRGAQADGLEHSEYEFEPHMVDGDVRDQATPVAFVTETMAELYLQQGFHEEALQVYKQLLEANPGDETLQSRVRSLEGGGRTSLAFEVSEDVVRAAQERHARGNRPTARHFFASLAMRRAPGRGDAHPAYAPVPYDATGADTSAMDAATFGAADAAHAQDEGSAGWPSFEADSPEAGHTYHENAFADSHDGEHASGGAQHGEGAPHGESSAFDAMFAEDAPAQAPQAPTTAEPWTDAARPTPARGTGEYDVAAFETSAWREEPAAPAPAPVPTRRPTPATPATPTVSGSVDALFGAPAASAADLAAAQALAGAFAGTPGAIPAVRPATGELSLDQVFRATPHRGGQAQRRDSASFSFDQFFSESAGEPAAREAPAPPPAPAGGAPDAGAAGADIEQFTAWLEGLKKK